VTIDLDPRVHLNTAVSGLMELVNGLYAFCGRTECLRFGRDGEDTATVGAVVYATEAGIFRKVLGVPTVVCGPGDIAQAHAADEWIATEQIEKCSAFLARLGDWAERGTAIR